MKPDFWFKESRGLYLIYGPLGFYKSVDTREEAVDFVACMFQGQLALEQDHRFDEPKSRNPGSALGEDASLEA